MDDKQLLILSRYPDKLHPHTRIQWEYKVSEDNPDVITVNKDVIFVLEDALDQIENGISLREAAQYLNSKIHKKYALSHMGLNKIRKRLRPHSVQRKVIPRTKRRSDVDRLEEKRKKAIANDKKRIAHAKKRIEKAEEELYNIKEDKEASSSPLFVLPQDHEILQETVLPEGLEDQEVIFKPHPKQALFLAAWERQVLYGGAAGGGKSFALLADAARYFDFPNFRGLLLRRTNDELKELIWESLTLYKKLHPKAKWNSQDKQWTFPSGATLWLNYLEQEKDVLLYQGQSFVWVGFDELTQYPTPHAWNYMYSRLRTKDPILRPYLSLRGTTNPGGPGHGWVKKMFIDPAPYNTTFPAMDEDGEIMLIPEGDPDYTPEQWGTPLFYRRFIPAKLSDNPTLAEGGEYKSNLLSMPENLRRQLLDGDWTVPDGAAFPEFRRSIHVCKKFELPASWRRFRSCDFGYSQKSASAVHWFAIDPDNTLYCYRELYVKGLTGKMLARKILEIEHAAGEKMDYGVLDSSVWHMRGQEGPSIAEVMIAEGCRWKPSDRTAGARSNGKNMLHEFLRVDEFTERPGLIFFENCTHIIADLEVIPVSPDGEDDIDKKYADDHAYDSVRYAVMTRPRAADIWSTFGSKQQMYRPADNHFGY